MPRVAPPKAPKVFENAKPKEKPYLIADGDGLSLMVTPEGGKRWIFRYRMDGKAKKLAIKGGFPAVSVKAAREEVARFREMLARGEDPGEVRKASKQEASRQAEEVRKEEEKSANTFEKVAREYIARASEHLEPVTVRSKLRQLELNIFPWVGSKPIASIRPPDLLAPLRLVEERGARETAHRILGSCGEIFRYAVASGILESDPSRDLRGALGKHVKTHLGALTNPEDVAGLLRAVGAYRGSLVTRVALRLGILTFVRPGNLRSAEWSEFHDLDNPERAEWRIPGEKMKVRSGRPFVVPMAPQAVRLLEEIHPLTGRGRFVFPSEKTTTLPMSVMTVVSALRRMGYTPEEMTAHGVRAMARTLCHEVLGFAPEVIEEQLAHGKSGPLGGAYDRTTHMPERRRLMRAWADYLDGLKGPGQISSKAIVGQPNGCIRFL